MPKVFIRNYLIFTAILVMCVTGLGYILISGEREIDRSDEWVIHTHETIIESERLSTLIALMASAQRGYIISGDENFLNDYNERKAAISQHIANLSELAQDNASQQSRLEEMRQYFGRFAEQLEKTIQEGVIPLASRKALQDVENIKNLKADIFRINEAFLDEEYSLLNQRIRTVEHRKNQYFLTLLIGGGSAIILLMLFNGYLLRVQSKRSAAETALSEREEIFRLAVEGTNDGVFDWDLKTRKAFYSGQFSTLLGYEPFEIEPTIDAFEEKLHPDEKDDVLEHIELYIGGQLSEYSNVFRMQHKSGRWVWINSRARLLHNKNGEAVRMVGAHTDVSASKEYEQRLQEAKTKAEGANQAKSDFLAHMSHEIRTPLTTISGAAEILQKGNDNLTDKQKELLRVLNTSAISLKDLISDVLDFSKIENNEMDLEEKLFDLHAIFQQIISIMSVKAAEKSLDFKFIFDDVKDLQYYGDPTRMRQVLINLIGNAIKFTEKGEVTVKAYKEEISGTGLLRIDVEDSGIGIKEEHMDLVFERFKQADSSVSRKFGGTGLGLPISKKLANLMGGDLQVTSTFGEGSTFSLIIPLRTVEETEKEEKKTKTKKKKINDKLKSTIRETDKILLVEDYEGNVVVLSYILESMGIDFDVAKTGLEALNMWNENHYDMVLMDIQMPEMDGFTATKQIRKIEEEENIDATPIIGMTAHALVGDKDKCIEAGMDAYLPKPIVEVDLKATILKFLKEKRQAA
jgi:PAS domain S-box-containing protein